MTLPDFDNILDLATKAHRSGRLIEDQALEQMEPDALDETEAVAMVPSNGRVRDGVR